MVRKFVTIIIFSGFFQYAVAQERDCGAVLDEAKKEFAAGHLDMISDILMGCMNKGFNDDQKIDAYRLLTITYLYLDDHYQAEESFKKLLEIDYEYQVLPTDPIEMEYLSRKFITTPIVSYSGRLGSNLSTISVIYRNPTGSGLDNNWNYKPTFGANFLGGVELYFDKAWSLNLELEFAIRTFAYNDSIFQPVDPQWIEQSRTNLHGSTPIFFKYTFAGEKKGDKKGEKRIYYPYVYAGYSPSYTFGSNARNIRDPSKEVKIEGSQLSLIGSTAKFSHSLIFGVGLKRRIKYNYILVDFRYRLGMTNMLDVSNQYNIDDPAIKENLFKYLIAGDDYRWNGFELTVGYVWPKYKVREKSSVTIQTFFSNMFSKKSKKDE